MCFRRTVAVRAAVQASLRRPPYQHAVVARSHPLTFSCWAQSRDALHRQLTTIPSPCWCIADMRVWSLNWHGRKISFFWARVWIDKCDSGISHARNASVPSATMILCLLSYSIPRCGFVPTLRLKAKAYFNMSICSLSCRSTFLNGEVLLW